MFYPFQPPCEGEERRQKKSWKEALFVPRTHARKRAHGSKQQRWKLVWGMLMMCLVTSTGDKNTLRAQVFSHCERLVCAKRYKRWLQWEKHTVANSQQSAVIQSTLLFWSSRFMRSSGRSEKNEEEGKKKKLQRERRVPGREKAKRWLCPTNCGFLWCFQWCLTTLMIPLCVFTHRSPSLSHCKTSATFSDVVSSFFFFSPSTQLSVPLRFFPSFASLYRSHTHHTNRFGLLMLTLQPSHVITP